MIMTSLNPEGFLSKKMKLVGLDTGVYDEHNEGYVEVFKDFPKDKMVYLTADSPNIIERFEKDHIYIIGGIVDRNWHKNLCFEWALTDGISHGKFPIKESINLGDYSTVLTVNHVVDLILDH